MSVIPAYVLPACSVRRGQIRVFVITLLIMLRIDSFLDIICVFTIQMDSLFWIFDISIWGEIMAPPNFSKFYRSHIRDWAITFLNFVKIALFLDIICVLTILNECLFSIFDFSILGEIMGPKIFQNSIALKSEIGHKFLKYCQNCVISGYNVAFHPIYQINLSSF